MSDFFVNCLNLATDTAEASGKLIRENWQKPQKIDYKGAIDLVTSVDRESEHLIVGRLRDVFPNHSFLAEEETTITAESDYRWIIDPLDGTTNFAHGYPQFCISLAPEHNAKVIVGIVYDPIRDECFKAALGQGSTLNDRPIRTPTTEELDKALLATGFPYDRRDFADFYLTYF